MPAVTRSSFKRINGDANSKETVSVKSKRFKPIALQPAEELDVLVTETDTTPDIKSSIIDVINLDHFIEEFQKGLHHVIAVDPLLAPVIHRAEFSPFQKVKHTNSINSKGGTDSSHKPITDSDEELDYFRVLARGIMGQQVSGASARSTANKFIASFHPEPSIAIFTEDDPNRQKSNLTFPTPQQVIDAPTEQLRQAGLSGRKAEYIQCLSRAFLDRQLTAQFLREASDSEIMERLVSIKGLGPWSVEMFLLFGLVRMDVFSVGDLGVRRGLAHYLKYFRPDLIKEMRDEVDWENVLEGKFGKPNSRKYPKSKPKEGGSKAKWQEPGLFELAYVAEKFRPYRTAFMMVLWELSMVDLGIFTEKK